MEQDLKARAAILVNFTDGLIHLSNNDLENANASAQAAIKMAETSTESFSGKENLYLMAAHIQTALKNYDISNQLLDQAFEINPNYARAHVARGNIYYGQATQSEPYDEVLLDKALVEYQSAYKSQDQPRGANIPIKANKSIGNIFFMRAQNTNDTDLYWKAIEYYQFVIDIYDETKNPALQELVATTYFDIGIAYERVGNMQMALQSYEKSLQTTTDTKFGKIVENQINISKQSLDIP